MKIKVQSEYAFHRTPLCHRKTDIPVLWLQSRRQHNFLVIWQKYHTKNIVISSCSKTKDIAKRTQFLLEHSLTTVTGRCVVCPISNFPQKLYARGTSTNRSRDKLILWQQKNSPEAHFLFLLHSAQQVHYHCKRKKVKDILRQRATDDFRRPK